MWSRRLQFRSKVAIFMLPLLLPVGGAGFSDEEPGARRSSVQLSPVPAAALSVPADAAPHRRGDATE